MTISDHIESKIKRAKLVALISWLIFAGISMTPGFNDVLILFLVPFAVFFGAILYVLFYIKCPSCNHALGQVAAYSGNPFQKKSNLNYCPNCGVDFKNEM